METGIHAMLAKLDPYTRYFPESKMEDVRFMQTGEYGGIGASVERTEDGTFVVVDLLDNEPAQQAGLRWATSCCGWTANDSSRCPKTALGN